MVSPELLRRFSLFAGLDAGAFKSLAMAGEEITLKAGDWLFHEGDEADALYLILSGSLDLTINLDKEGSRQADLCTLVEGDAVGWSALVEPHTYKLGAVAASDARLIRLDADQLRDLMISRPEVGYMLMHRIAQVIGNRLNNLRVRFVSLIETA